MTIWKMAEVTVWTRISELQRTKRYNKVTPQLKDFDTILFMKDNTVKSRPVYVPQQRIVHLDLKGAPPSIQYIKKVLTMSKSLGATGVLVEWEDMFPWSGR